MNKPLILTDVDDVCLNWLDGFKMYAARVLNKDIPDNPQSWDMSGWLGVTPDESSQMIYDFNHGEPEFGKLPPTANAEKFVPLLAKHCDIVAITCCSTDSKAVALRKQNLESVFGKGIFQDIICQPLGTDKIDNLSVFLDRNVVAWVEDKHEAALHGHFMGYRSFLMEQSHNKLYRDQNPHGPLLHVKSWEDIALQVI